MSARRQTAFKLQPIDWNLFYLFICFTLLILKAGFHQLQSQGLNKIKQLAARLSNAGLELHL